MSARPPVSFLERLADVAITSPTDGQSLIFNSGLVKWENVAIPGTSLDTLSDVLVGTPINGQVLVFSGGSWINYGPLAFGDITGNIAISQMAGGSGADAFHYWRGDNSWAAPPVGAVATTPNILIGDNAGNATDASLLNLNLIAGSLMFNPSGNFVTRLTVANTDSLGTDTVVIASLTLQSASNLYLEKLGPFFTTSGIFVADDARIYTDGGNLDLAVSTAKFLKFSNDNGNTERLRIGTGLMVGTTVDGGAGTVNVNTGYQVKNATLSEDYRNGSTAGATGFATNTAIPGSVVTVAAGAWKAGGAYHCVFDMAKTAAGTATIVINVHMGINGTVISDPVVGTVTFAAGTAAAEMGYFDVYVTFKAVGSGTSAVIVTAARKTGPLTSTGLTAISSATPVTSSGFNSTTQTKMTLGFNGGASFVGTNTFAQAEYKQ